MGNHDLETDDGPEEFLSWEPSDEDSVLHTDDPSNPGNLTSAEYFDAISTIEENEGDKGLHIIPEEYLPAEDPKLEEAK